MKQGVQEFNYVTDGADSFGFTDDELPGRGNGILPLRLSALPFLRSSRGHSGTHFSRRDKQTPSPLVASQSGDWEEPGKWRPSPRRNQIPSAIPERVSAHHHPGKPSLNWSPSILNPLLSSGEDVQQIDRQVPQ